MQSSFTLLPHSTVATFILATLLGTCPWDRVQADTVLETETAELGEKGEWLISNSIQYEKGPDGKAAFTLFQFEYGVTSRSEILIEPFFHEWVWPKGENKTSGLGDLEITPSYIALLETDNLPAIATAFKLKVPTASNPAIGTGEYDYYPYLIFGKHFGKDWILNANFGYDFITNIPGENFKNQFIYDLSVERRINDDWSVFAEVFANSKPSPDEKGTFAGAVAVEYQVNKHFNVFVSTGYDTDKTWNIRPGFNIHF
jgi:hypothetical protein